MGISWTRRGHYNVVKVICTRPFQMKKVTCTIWKDHVNMTFISPLLNFIALFIRPLSYERSNSTLTNLLFDPRDIPQADHALKGDILDTERTLQFCKGHLYKTFTRLFHLDGDLYLEKSCIGHL